MTSLFSALARSRAIEPEIVKTGRFAGWLADTPLGRGGIGGHAAGEDHEGQHPEQTRTIHH